MDGQEVPSFGQVWALGFMFAVENWPEDWAAPRDKDAARWLDDALDSIVALTEDDTGKPEVCMYSEDGPPSTSQARVETFGEAIWAVYDLRQLWKSLGPRQETIVKGEQPGRKRVFAVAVAMLGLVLATGILEQAASQQGTQAQYWQGVGMCLLGAFLTAAVTVIARRLRAMPAGVLAWWQCAVGSAVLWMAPATQGWPAWGAAWGWLAALGLVHTATAYALIYTGMARLPTGRIAVLQFVYPAIAIVVDWQYFGHRLGALQMGGGLVMGAAIWYAERRASGKTA